jgi:hypothetical protein
LIKKQTLRTHQSSNNVTPSLGHRLRILKFGETPKSLLLLLKYTDYIALLPQATSLTQVTSGISLVILLRISNGAEFADYLLASFACTTSNQGENIMPASDKFRSSKREKRQAEHIEETYEARGYSEKEAERKAWATVNKVHGESQKLDGSGYDTEESDEALPRSGKRNDVHRDRTNRDEIEPE